MNEWSFLEMSRSSVSSPYTVYKIGALYPMLAGGTCRRFIDEVRSQFIQEALGACLNPGIRSLKAESQQSIWGVKLSLLSGRPVRLPPPLFFLLCTVPLCFTTFDFHAALWSTKSPVFQMSKLRRNWLNSCFLNLAAHHKYSSVSCHWE